MPKQKTKPDRFFNNPFTESFLLTWDLWKQYKKEEFKFSYKSSLTEQTAIDHLFEISNGKEDVAIAIVKQSIGNGWKGLFELKNFGNGKTNRRFASQTHAHDRGDVDGTNWNLTR